MAFDWQQFSPKALDVIFGDHAAINLLDGAVSSGKTVSSLIAWVHYLMEAPPGRMAMIGRTRATLKRNCLDPLIDMFGSGLVRVNHGLGEALIGGREVYLFGASDVRAEENIRGGTWAGAYGDEATLYSEEFFNMLLSRLRVPGAKVFLTTNPDNPAHHLYEKLIARSDQFPPGHFRRWQFTMDDNPSLDPEYVARMKRQYVGLWYDRFILGKWTIAEGAVYGPHYSIADNAVRACDVPLITQYYVGVDFATSASTAYVLLGLGIDQCLYVLGEYVYSGNDTGNPKTVTDLVQDLNEFTAAYPVKWAFVDPSAAPLLVQMRRTGHVKAKRGFDRDVNLGIQWVATLIGNRRLKFVTECLPVTMKELVSYVWDENWAKRGIDKAKKENDHCMDALRYAIVGMRGLWKAWVSPDKPKLILPYTVADEDTLDD